MKPLLITIDGPAGAGKTTVSRRLAERLNYRYIDTGALYRSIAYKVKLAGIRPDDDEGLERLCQNMAIDYISTPEGAKVIVNGTDVTHVIRTPEISMLSSAVSARPVVRTYLLTLQRRLGAEKRAIFEGRDMGTVVFPDADIKFFLLASLEERARRRFLETAEHSSMTLEQIQLDIQRRDLNDSSRQIAPLIPAKDAIPIDSSAIPPDIVVEKMLSVIYKNSSP